MNKEKVKTDVDRLEEFLQDCKAIWLDREKQYGALWKDADPEVFLHPIKMKLKRIEFQLNRYKAREAMNRGVVGDSLKDIVNYAALLAMRVDAD